MTKHTTGVPNYLLLDGARVDAALDNIRKNNEDHACLYKGKSEQALAGQAPYLFTFSEKIHVGMEYLQHGWQDHWGILFDTSYPIEAMINHFRKFLIVQTEDFKELYFRFYDPRVLRLFLPTCDSKQLKEFFGPINHFYCADEDPDYVLIFSLNDDNKLITERKSATTISPRLAKETTKFNPSPIS